MRKSIKVFITTIGVSGSFLLQSTPNKKNNVEVGQVDKESANIFFGEGLPTRYWVTYHLDPKGKFQVYHSLTFDRMGIIRKSNHKSFDAVCFLPKEWEGMGVSREIKVSK